MHSRIHALEKKEKSVAAAGMPLGTIASITLVSVSFEILDTSPCEDI